MDCAIKSRSGEQALTDYCAGTLDALQAAAFEMHLRDCRECRRIVDAQREVWGALGQFTPPEVSPDFDARLYARIRSEEEVPAWRKGLRRLFQPAVPWTTWKPAVSLAGACMLLALGFLVRVPESRDLTPRMERVDLEQAEEALEDLEMLTPSSAAAAIAK